jgi:hypothetical protein
VAEFALAGLNFRLLLGRVSLVSKTLRQQPGHGVHFAASHNDCHVMPCIAWHRICLTAAHHTAQSWAAIAAPQSASSCTRGTDIDIFGATYTFDVIMSCCDVSTDARPPAANRLLLEWSACVK